MLSCFGIPPRSHGRTSVGRRLRLKAQRKQTSPPSPPLPPTKQSRAKSVGVGETSRQKSVDVEH